MSRLHKPASYETVDETAWVILFHISYNLKQPVIVAYHSWKKVRKIVGKLWFARQAGKCWACYSSLYSFQCGEISELIGSSRRFLKRLSFILQKKKNTVGYITILKWCTKLRFITMIKKSVGLLAYGKVRFADVLGYFKVSPCASIGDRLHW